MDTSFIRVNFNSSIRIEAENKVIYVDPYKIEGNPSDADYIFLTNVMQTKALWSLLLIFARSLNIAVLMRRSFLLKQIY